MNWLDLAIIITVIGGTFFGLWIGFVRAAFTALGIIVGILVAGMVTDNADVLVIGAGASGATVAWSPSQAEIKVVCLEQGGWLDPSTFPTTDLDHEVHRQTDFNPDPNFRQLPSDYPVQHSESAILVCVKLRT